MPRKSHRKTHTAFFSYGTKILLISHSLFWLATNLVGPTSSFFFLTQLNGVTLTEVGIATLIFFLSFGLLEPVIGYLADHIKGLKDEVFFIFFGYLARGIIFFLFSMATNSWHLYMFQFSLGITRALAGPADKVLFSKYLSSKRTATMWGIDESLINIAGALGAGFGGYLIMLHGFRSIFVITGILTILAGLINLLLLRKLRAANR